MCVFAHEHSFTMLFYQCTGEVLSNQNVRNYPQGKSMKTGREDRKKKSREEHNRNRRGEIFPLSLKINMERTKTTKHDWELGTLSKNLDQTWDFKCHKKRREGLVLNLRVCGGASDTCYFRSVSHHFLSSKLKIVQGT